ncbi:MAG TPA: PaaI family thioesterase [Ramlibacter sp.]|nr:PaaI family thioesterase [Ramlibacter sp.]
MALDYPVPIPFADRLGIALLAMGDGAASVGCSAEASLCNSYGTAHGGLLMALLDLAMVHAARSPRAGEPTPPTRCVTINMNTSFLKGGTGALRAEARVVSRTRSLAFCEASVVDAEQQVLARASATFRLVQDH